MAAISFRAKLLLFISGLVVASLSVVIVAIVLTTNSTVNRNIDRELGVAERVFTQLLEIRESQLNQSATVLADDFGFRQAVATGDENTILSVLVNHGQRVAADLITLISPSGEIVVSTHEIAAPETLMTMSTTDRETDFGLIVAEGEIYQLVVVPVRAPHLIGYVVLGFVVDDSLATQLYQLTNTQITFVARFEEREPIVVSSSSQLMESGFSAAVATESQVHNFLSENELRGNWITLEGSQTLEGIQKKDLSVLISASVKEAAAPFSALRSNLIAIALVTLTLSTLLAMLIGNQVVEPVRMLANVAKRIAGGRYDQRVEVSKQDEIGQLANSFNKMQSAISEREARISHQSFHDLLTDLPNRRFLNEKIDENIQKNNGFVIAVLNLDNFSRLNDMFGQTICDQLLVRLAERLKNQCEDLMWPSHLHGDEFVVLIPEENYQGVEQIRDMLAFFNQPYDLEQVTYNLQVSAGIVQYPQGGEDIDILLRRAQFARLRARENKSSIGVFELGDDEPHMRKLQVAAALRDITESGQLSLAYQPQLDIQSKKIHGVEALIRWIHPELGFVSPVEFIPLAEQSGDITRISYWVIHEAARQVAQWAEKGHHLNISINLSAADLIDEGLIEHIMSCVNQYKLKAENFTFEVTESLVMVDPERSIQRLNALKQAGMGVAIDDYGTGYSSLSQMRSLPADELKVDRAFVMEIDTNQDDQTIVQSTIDLAHRLNMRVVAEGVEEQSGWAQLGKFNCDILQGYYIAKPMKGEDFTSWLEAFDYDQIAPK
ncbi:MULTISPECIES: bifunctional diguanylate cyclase/phosphodiesterase [Gammaproteobacteria]|uniref:putative bifunctional diguanylate cyclase/phosphodiesterase n=1 Tax=Gammaproteobacteria TaxID=1236 RepID=UPI000DCF6B7B|nr:MULTISPECIES: EAL domain-containing protein [Gammaproteobacteria]RTE87439.1 EAL domain-containing protein [Aliidiomarina sp. B3213]TCZ92776.1 EAL domain-containing protein [Lysobacter sp. N42]